jgi:hypothetical protein
MKNYINAEPKNESNTVLSRKEYSFFSRFYEEHYWGKEKVARVLLQFSHTLILTLTLIAAFNVPISVRV